MNLGYIVQKAGFKVDFWVTGSLVPGCTIPAGI
ncbi:Uncharacterised protein [Cedecea neteri]|uniref:Uncharacterized protein n=1 Tax=Cedecea neteri TaxID=158822 RepID=A0A2X3L103_9ENTR|nr:Uncharacterised protein [Cedecea neteri]